MHGGGNAVKKVWRKVVGAELKNSAEKVFDACSGNRPEVHCKTFGKGVVQVAVFLQSREKHPGRTSVSPNAGRVKIAYRSYHPKPFWFTRKCICQGGTIEEHSGSEKFEIPAGKTEGRAFKTDLVVDGIDVKAGINGGLVSAEICFQDSEPVITQEPLHYSVSFPSDGLLKCLCC